jgi:hypothetical protein
MASSIDYTLGSARIDLSTTDPTKVAELDARRNSQVLVEDLRRTRASYEDGRFLTAKDLTREQTYALTREADIASCYRGGVLRGLELTRFGDQLRLSAGAGFTPSGELVSLGAPLAVAIQQVPEDDRIDLSNGLVDVSEPPQRSRTGVYILGLRPGEYATKPVTRYALTARGTPGIEDGDIVEATALALHPLRIDLSEDPVAVRSSLARTAFFELGSALPSDLLSLAVVYLSGGTISWFDPDLVRRDVAAEDLALVGVTSVERAAREAHFLQYDRQLAELMMDLRARGGLKFPASRYFRCLPPIGRMPVEAIDPSELTCAYFPPQMTVSLSVVVDEELPALIEDSFHLPPIDLEGDPDDFDFSYIQVLVPMPASSIARLRLEPVTLTRPIALPPVLANRLPVLALRDFLNRRKPPPGPDFGTDARPESAALLAAWRQALAAAPDRMVWFVRVPALTIAPVALFDAGAGKGDAKEKEKEKDKEKDKDKEASADKTANDDKPPASDKQPATDKQPISDKTNTFDKPIVDKTEAADKSAAADKAVTDKQPVTDKTAAADKSILDKASEKLDKQPVADKSAAADKASEKLDKQPVADKASDKLDKQPVVDKSAAADTKTADKQPVTDKNLAAEKIHDKTAEKTLEKTAEKTLEKSAAAEKPAHDVHVTPIVPVPHDITQPQPGAPTNTPTPTPVEGPGRTFIQPTERPDVGSTVIRKTRDA